MIMQQINISKFLFGVYIYPSSRSGGTEARRKRKKNVKILKMPEILKIVAHVVGMLE